MSEYLSKKAVLEWLESEMSINKGHPDDIDIHWTLNRVSKKIQSGAFDAEQMKNFEDFLQNYEDFQRKYEHYQTEVQRLRAALHKITQIYDDPNLHDLTACHEMNRVAKEALSTTTEPTNKYFGAEWPKAEGDGNDA